jgi:uncharacterized protein involved in exopolysaccharide biosynthesis
MTTEIPTNDNGTQLSPRIADARAGWVDGLTILGVANAVLRRRGWVFLFGVITPLAVLAFVLSRGRTYTSTASFVPESKRSTSSALSGLAAQLGVGLPAADAAQSPAFYVDLVTSREVLRAVADSTYAFETKKGLYRGTLLGFVRPQESDTNRRAEATLEWLRRAVQANASVKTGVVTIAVSAPSPSLARMLAQGVLKELNKFNLEKRKTQASAERQFDERQLQEARSALSRAEQTLQEFSQHNRGFVRTSELKFEEDRLTRDMMFRQQVFTTLAQSYEQAKIEEVRETAMITPIEQPNTPVRPDSRGLLPLAILLIVVGGAVGIAFAVGHYLAGADRTSDAGYREFEEFQRLRRAALSDVVRPWQPISRLVRRRA